MQVLLYPNLSKDEGLRVTRRICALLRSLGAQVLVEETFGDLLSDAGAQALPSVQAWEQADTVVTIGGDGTLLRAGEACSAHGKPVLGVNLGRTGFLATCELEEVEDKITRLVRGECDIEPRSLLHASCKAHSWQHNAINDVVLYGKSRLHPMDYTVLCDDVPVGRYRCDGIIVATPTGSTAYAFSAGGAVLDALGQMVEVIPICPHGGRRTPLVLAAGRRLSVLTEPENRDNVFVCADSQHPCELHPGERVELRLSQRQLSLVSFAHAEQFRAVIDKLMRR